MAQEQLVNHMGKNGPHTHIINSRHDILKANGKILKLAEENIGTYLYKHEVVKVFLNIVWKTLAIQEKTSKLLFIELNITKTQETKWEKSLLKFGRKVEQVFQEKLYQSGQSLHK